MLCLGQLRHSSGELVNKTQWFDKHSTTCLTEFLLHRFSPSRYFCVVLYGDSHLWLHCLWQDGLGHLVCCWPQCHRLWGQKWLFRSISMNRSSQFCQIILLAGSPCLWLSYIRHFDAGYLCVFLPAPEVMFPQDLSSSPSSPLLWKWYINFNTNIHESVLIPRTECLVQL